MTSVRKIECHLQTDPEYAPTELFLLCLTQDDTTVMCKAALHWNVDKDKAMEMICNAGLTMLREVLP